MSLVTSVLLLAEQHRLYTCPYCLTRYWTKRFLIFRKTVIFLLKLMYTTQIQGKTSYFRISVMSEKAVIYETANHREWSLAFQQQIYFVSAGKQSWSCATLSLQLCSRIAWRHLHSKSNRYKGRVAVTVQRSVNGAWGEENKNALKKCWNKKRKEV